MSLPYVVVVMSFQVSYKISKIIAIFSGCCSVPPQKKVHAGSQRHLQCWSVKTYLTSLKSGEKCSDKGASSRRIGSFCE